MASKALGRSMPSKKTPLWLISFADVVMLMLCFLIMLVGFTAIDQKSELHVLSSVDTHFGTTDRLTSNNNYFSLEDSLFSSLKDFSAFIEPFQKNVQFKQSGNLHILSMGPSSLFQPGSSTLSQKGTSLLDGLVPFLQKIDVPFIIAGHTAPRQDEEKKVILWQNSESLSPMWELSFERAKTVYEHFVSRGIPAKAMTMKAFAEFHPEFSNYSPTSRTHNRRVELILRTKESVMKGLPPLQKEEENSLYYRGFKFDVTIPDGKKVNQTPHDDKDLSFYGGTHSADGVYNISTRKDDKEGLQNFMRRRFS